MAIVDRVLSGDDSQDEANLQRALPTMFQRMALTQMSLPLRPIFGPNPTQEETEQEGRLLLRDFVSQQIERDHVILDEPENEEQDPARLVYSHLAGPTEEPIPSPEQVLRSHPMYRDVGRQLSLLADEFSRSRERQQVKQQAEALRMSTITKNNLIELMSELFRDGFSRERLVTLFYFCSDLIIKAMRETQSEGIRWEILGWVWEFFCDRVCAWVCEHGGWENVLFNYLPKAVMVTTGVAITAGIAFYIWKNW